MHAFLFWYKSSEDAPTEYIYVIAVTLKQAQYFYIRRGYTSMFDYSTTPVDDIDEEDFLKPHHVGDILGQYATI